MDAEREVVEGDPALVTDDNFRLTFLEEESLRAFLDDRTPPPGTTAIVRRASTASPGGAEWDLYAHGWDPWGAGDEGLSRGEGVVDDGLIDFEDL